MAGRSRSTSAAFSLLELTIASLILLLALALSARLLQDVAVQIAHSGRKAIEVSPDLALEQIRTDLRGSAGSGASGFGLWQDAPLHIQGSSTGYAISYLVREGKLLRLTTDPSGRQEERLVLDKVVALRYRENWYATEIEVEFLRMKPLLRKDTAAGTRESLPPEHRRMTILVNPRRHPVERF